MGRLGRSQVAVLLSVLFVLGAAAFAAVAQLPAPSAPASAQERLAIGPGEMPRPVPTPERPPRAPDEPPGPAEPRREIHSSGPATRGAVIHVAGREVQLPPDAFIERSVAAVLCGGGLPCPETPFYILRRGNSTVSVSLRSGARFDEQIAPGEEGAFDFLREATR
jgi:hypothetical protein